MVTPSEAALESVLAVIFAVTAGCYLAGGDRVGAGVSLIAALAWSYLAGLSGTGRSIEGKADEHG